MASSGNDPPGIRRFGYARERQVVGLAGGLLLALIARREAHEAGEAAAGLAPTLLLFSLEGAGLIVAAAFLCAVLDRRAALEVRAEGIWAPRQMPRLLRWSEVAAVTLRVTHLRRMRTPTLEIAEKGRERRPARVPLLKLDAPEGDILEAIERVAPLRRAGDPLRRAGRR